MAKISDATTYTDDECAAAGVHRKISSEEGHIMVVFSKLDTLQLHSPELRGDTVPAIQTIYDDGSIAEFYYTNGTKTHPKGHDYPAEIMYYNTLNCTEEFYNDTNGKRIKSIKKDHKETVTTEYEEHPYGLRLIARSDNGSKRVLHFNQESELNDAPDGSPACAWYGPNGELVASQHARNGKGEELIMHQPHTLSWTTVVRNEEDSRSDWEKERGLQNPPRPRRQYTNSRN